MPKQPKKSVGIGSYDMGQKHLLETVYHTHHVRGNRYGYLFCHGVRGPYLEQWIGTEKTILDLGCRDGMLTQFFTRGNRVLGVDIDREALERARKKLDIETMWLDLNAEWPFDGRVFDVIVACEILEHLYLLEPFVDKLAGSLQKGGLFLGSVPNAFRMRNRWKFLFGREFETDPTHVRSFSYQKLFDLLSRRFSSVEIIPIRGSILPFLPVSPHMPKRLNRLFAGDLLWRAVR